MQSNEMIKDLYNNFFDSGEHPRICHLLNQRIDETTKQLRKNINSKNKKKLDRICKDYQKVNLIETEDEFIRGFSYAIQLMSEAYSHK